MGFLELLGKKEERLVLPVSSQGPDERRRRLVQKHCKSVFLTTVFFTKSSSPIFPPQFSIKSCGFFGQFSDVASSGFFSFHFLCYQTFCDFFPKISKISLMYKLLGDKISKTFPNCFWKKTTKFCQIKKH